MCMWSWRTPPHHPPLLDPPPTTETPPTTGTPPQLEPPQKETPTTAPPLRRWMVGALGLTLTIHAYLFAQDRQKCSLDVCSNCVGFQRTKKKCREINHRRSCSNWKTSSSKNTFAPDALGHQIKNCLSSLTAKIKQLLIPKLETLRLRHFKVTCATRGIFLSASEEMILRNLTIN